MFRAEYRSSSGALNFICSLWFIYTCGVRLLSRLSLDNGRSPHVYINQRLQIQFRAPDDERYAARNMLSLKINYGIINSNTRLHLDGCFYWVILRCTDPWISNLWTAQKQTHFLSSKRLFANTWKVSVRTVGQQLTKWYKGENKQVTPNSPNNRLLLDFKLSPCSVCCMFSSG